MFNLHSLKEPPPKKMCEAINFTSEGTISSQESQSPPIQRFDSVANRIEHFNSSGFRNFSSWRDSRDINCLNATKYYETIQ